MALDPEWVADQARAVLEDMPVNVFEIGMLGSVEIIASIAEVISGLSEYSAGTGPGARFRAR